MGKAAGLSTVGRDQFNLRGLNPMDVVASQAIDRAGPADGAHSGGQFLDQDTQLQLRDKVAQAEVRTAAAE